MQRDQSIRSARTRRHQKAAARVISSRSRNASLDFGLLRNFQCIVHLDAEVANGALQLGMAN